MKTCLNCKEVSSESSKFCTSCGEIFAATSVAAAGNNPIRNIYRRAGIDNQTGISNKALGANEQEKQTGLILLIIVGVLLLVFLFAPILFVRGYNAAVVMSGFNLLIGEIEVSAFGYSGLIEINKIENGGFIRFLGFAFLADIIVMGVMAFKLFSSSIYDFKGCLKYFFINGIAALSALLLLLIIYSSHDVLSIGSSLYLMSLFFTAIVVIAKLQLNKLSNPNSIRATVGFLQPRLSSTDELIKFKKLLDDGVITQEDFDTKKKELLRL